MRRIVVLLAGVAAALAGLVLLSPIARSATVVVSDPAKVATIAGLTEYNKVGSSDTSQPTGTFTTVDGPGQPPSGTGSLQVSVGSNGDTGVGLFDQSYLNYYYQTGMAAPVMFPVTYQPAALALKFGYYRSSSTVPLKVEITLWHGSAPAVYQASLTGDGWQSFDIATAQLVAASAPTGPSNTLTGWAQPGDSLFAVFVGIDYDSNAAGDSFNLDQLTYGLNVTQGPAVNPPATYDFETSGGVSGPALAPWAGPATTTGGSSLITDPGKLAAASALSQYDQASSSDTSKPTGSFGIVAGPGTPPSGSGHSLQLSVGSNGDTGVGLFDQSYLNYYYQAGMAAPVMFPVTYQPAALQLSFAYNLSSASVPFKVEITLWRGASPVVYQATLGGTGWHSFDIATVPLVDASAPTGPAKTLAAWTQPGDSLFGVFVGIDYGSSAAGDTVSLDQLGYGFNVTQGPAVNAPTVYDFGVAPAGATSSSATPTPTDTTSPTPSAATPTPTPTPAAAATYSPAPYVPVAAGAALGVANPAGGSTAAVAQSTSSASPSGVSGSRSAAAAGQSSATTRAPIAMRTVSQTVPGGDSLLWARVALIVCGVILILVSRRRSTS